MASQNKALSTVIERYPEACHQITELFHHSVFFRSICENYADCLQVIKRLETSHQMAQKGYKREYKILLKELEEELISKLKECEDLNHYK